MDIDALMAEASTEATTTPAASTEAEVQPTPVTTTESPEDIGKKPDSELTPEQLAKREANRKSHENSKLAEMRRANRELQARIAQYEQSQKPAPQQPTEVKPQGEPQLDQFETWEDYNKALIRYEAKQIAEAQNKQTQETQRQQEFEKWKGGRAAHIDKREVELTSVLPDLSQELEEIESVIPSNLSPEMGMVILQAEDINLAAYALKKEGGLEAVSRVLQLPPLQAAMEIAKAEVRGQAYLTQKPTTNAPAPLTPARGNAVGSISIEKMDGVQLLKSIRKKG